MCHSSKYGQCTNTKYCYLIINNLMHCSVEINYSLALHDCRLKFNFDFSDKQKKVASLRRTVLSSTESLDDMYSLFR